MSRRVDIDALLGDDALEIVLAGTTYVVEDVMLDTFLQVSKPKDGEDPDIEDVHKQLASILGIKFEAIKGVGFRAAGLALKMITEWILEISPQEKSEGGEIEAGNP